MIYLFTCMSEQHIKLTLVANPFPTIRQQEMSDVLNWEKWCQFGLTTNTFISQKKYLTFLLLIQ